MSKRKLLLADDSVTIQKVVNLTFADEGIDVITVGDGNSAMAKISEMSPDVILADVHMPGLSGYQVCEMVRSNEATRQLPVVLLVGSFEPFDETEAARVGANAYLTKPFQSIRQLVSQVSDLIRTSSPEPEPTAPAFDEVSETDVTVPANMNEVGATGAARKVPDTTDIDRLYSQSFGGPAREDASAASAYVDAGMDDEMIEATHAETPEDEQLVDAGMDHEMLEATHAETPQEEQLVYVESPAAEEPAYAESAASDEPSEYEPAYTESETTEPASYQEPAQEGPAATDFAFVDGPAQAEQPVAEFGYREEEPPVQYDYIDQPAEEESKTASPFDSPAEADTDPNIGPVVEQDAYVDQFAATQSVGETSHESAKEYAFDEEDPLELPPLDEGKTIELTTSEGRKEVVSLSPELMDMLVERVKKELTEKS